MSKPGMAIALVDKRPHTLLESLFEEALTCRDAEQIAQCIEVIEQVYPEMHKEYGKLRAFSCDLSRFEYVPQITAPLIEERFEAAAATLLRDDDTILAEGSPRFRDLFDDTIKTDPI